MPVTKHQLFQVANEFLKSHITYEITNVVDGECTEPPTLPYNLGLDIWNRSWICYVNNKQHNDLLRSSTALFIDKENGKVNFFGMLNDEG